MVGGSDSLGKRLPHERGADSSSFFGSSGRCNAIENADAAGYCTRSYPLRRASVAPRLRGTAARVPPPHGDRCQQPASGWAAAAKRICRRLLRLCAANRARQIPVRPAAYPKPPWTWAGAPPNQRHVGSAGAAFG